MSERVCENYDPDKCPKECTFEDCSEFKVKEYYQNLIDDYHF